MRTKGATRNWQQRAQSLYQSLPNRGGSRIDWKSKMPPAPAQPPMSGGGGGMAQSAPTFRGGNMSGSAPQFGGGGMSGSAPGFGQGLANQMERMDPPGAPQQMPQGGGFSRPAGPPSQMGGGIGQSASQVSALGPQQFGAQQPLGKGPALQPAQNMQQGAMQTAQPSPLVDAMTGQPGSAQGYGPAMMRRVQ